jgi:nitroreductase
MVRAFDGTELDEDSLVELCSEAMRAPTAGHARGIEAVVLAGSAGVARYLTAATDASWRATSRRAAGFSRAGGVVVVLCDPVAYAARYAEDDKASSGLSDPAAWPVPYWIGDAGAFTMALLLLAEDAGLAACFLGAFRRRGALLAELGAPEGRLVYGAVLLGAADADQRASPSLDRPGRTRADRVVRGGF